MYGLFVPLPGLYALLGGSEGNGSVGAAGTVDVSVKACGFVGSLIDLNWRSEGLVTGRGVLTRGLFSR
jgi:hypothetical protein